MNYKAITVALILLVAGLVTIGQSSAAAAGTEIRATGTFTTTFSCAPAACVPNHTVGNLFIFSRFNVSTFAGSLEGTTVSLATQTQDAAVQKAFATTTGTFWGTLNGSEPGSFSLISHFVVDRSDLTLPVLPIEGKFVVIEGTGKGGLEGICGGGTFKSAIPLGSGTDYDFAFRFGSDCKANN